MTIKLWCRWMNSAFRAHRVSEPFWCRLRSRPYSTIAYYVEPSIIHRNCVEDAAMYRARERTRPMKLEMALKRLMLKMRDDGMRNYWHEGTSEWSPVNDESRYAGQRMREVAYQRGIAVRGEFWPWMMRMLRRKGFWRWLRFNWDMFHPIVLRDNP